MFIALSADNPDPMYQQVADQIKDAIAGGVVQSGQKLLSIREMAQALEISVITVKRAYLDLEHEGFLRTRAGLGTFVAEVDRDALRRGKRDEIRSELQTILVRAGKFGIRPAEVAAILAEIERDEDERS